MKSDKPPFKEVNIVLSQLQEIASGVMHAAEAHTLELVLERIAHVAMELVHAKYAALGVPEGDGTLRYFKVAGITNEEISLMDHFPHGRGLLGAVMQERATLRVDHIQDHPRSYGFPEHHPHMDRFLGAPIQVGDQLFGMLYLCDRIDGQPFDEQDQSLVETLAGYAALAIAGSELREQQNRLTLLEERERISMELHDGVIQSLYAVGMHLELLRGQNSEIDAGLRTAIGDLNVIIDDIRDYIMNLRIKEGTQETIRSCIRDLVMRLHVPPATQIEIDAPDSKPLFDRATFESICQIVNEALSNAVRHANATHIMVNALQNEQFLMITVRDNGRGFDPDQLPEHDGLGLRNMVQRAKKHHGEIKLESTPGTGTRLVLSVPVKLR